jgi:hypothetical protein
MAALFIGTALYHDSLSTNQAFTTQQPAQPNQTNKAFIHTPRASSSHFCELDGSSVCQKILAVTRN